MSNQLSVAIFHGLGDCINVTSMLPFIRKKWPDKKIKWITAAQYKGVVLNNPHITDIEIINESPMACDLWIPKLKQSNKELLLPAPYHNYGLAPGGSLLDIIKASIKFYTGFNTQYIKSELYITQQEVVDAEMWLKSHNLNKFIILESSFNSQSSNWDVSCTKKTIEILQRKGYSILLAHPKDSNIDLYNTIGHTVCLDMNYRYIPAIYNKSSGFIGNGSSATCAVYSHMCRIDIPHIEFYRGAHWGSQLFESKKSRKISYDISKLTELLNSF